MWRRLWRKESGQSLTELALILPVLLYLICGIIDFGRFMYTYMELNLVAQESVRLGGLGQNDTAIRSYALNRLSSVDPADLTITIAPADSLRKSGDYVEVQLEERVEWITPLLGKVLPSPLPIRAESSIRVE